MKKPKNPKTREEWQTAVDAAAAARALYDCKLYGLIEGGPEINAERCDAILDAGRKRNIRPSRPATELAFEMAVQWNATRPGADAANQL